MPIKRPTSRTTTAPAKAPRIKEEFAYASGISSLGPVLVAMSPYGIVSVILADTPAKLVEKLQARFPKTPLRAHAKAVKPALDKVIAFIDRPDTEFKLSLDMRGTPFQRRVWTAASNIPRGQSSTYSEIAEIIKAPRAMRAVGSSCTNNHFAVIVPCHRVLHKDETLAGQEKKGSKRRRALFARDLKGL